MRTLLDPLTRWATLLLVAAPLSAQSNANPGIDVELASVLGISALGRTGAFPTGANGIGITTNVCNKGTVAIEWRGPMDARHPFIAMLVARELDGRLTQISDRSYIKHGFSAATASFCDICQPAGGNFLGVGCSDAYSVVTNGDRLFLGPADEIDPWLGTWNPVCSHFDRGEPVAAPPLDCDGFRTLTNAQIAAFDPVRFRMRVSDADLFVSGARFYHQGYYVVQGEPEGVRDDNLRSDEFLAQWTGVSWSLSSTFQEVGGTVLQRWTGATVSSAANGNNDGRLYVAVKTADLGDGFTAYDYAVHNRDNQRGVRELRVPLCSGTRVRGIGFHDVDSDVGTDWTAALTAAGDELVFSAPAGGELRWNTIFNFWFEADAQPTSTTTVELVQADPGAGLPAVLVATTTPGVLRAVHLGPGCATGNPPTLFASGTPALGNGAFGLTSGEALPATPQILFFGTAGAPLALGACTLWTGPTPRSLGVAMTDGTGSATFGVPIPNDASLEGTLVRFQLASLDPSGSPALRSFALSEGLGVRVGNAVGDCP